MTKEMPFIAGALAVGAAACFALAFSTAVSFAEAAEMPALKSGAAHLDIVAEDKGARKTGAVRAQSGQPRKVARPARAQDPVQRTAQATGRAIDRTAKSAGSAARSAARTTGRVARNIGQEISNGFRRVFN